MFDISIVNENRGEYRYYIENEEDMEVLELEWLRKEIACTIKRMWNKYKE